MTPAEYQRQLKRTRRLRSDLTPEQREKAERIGSIMDQFKSAGVTRKTE
jgi:hypothetical protein